MARNPTSPLIEGLDLITSVELSHTQIPSKDARGRTVTKECYHFLYASYLYGTLFGVYGQFVTRPSGAKLAVTHLIMRILNYQGVLNIGFAAETPVYDPVTKALAFWVQGASGLDEKVFTFPLNSLLVEKGKRCRFTFNRYTTQLNGEPLETNPDPDDELDTPSQLEPYFDTEFYHRDGTAKFHQVRRAGRTRKDGEKLVGGRCLNSTVNLLYI